MSFRRCQSGLEEVFLLSEYKWRVHLIEQTGEAERVLDTGVSLQRSIPGRSAL